MDSVDPMFGPVAMITGRYPAVSMTFVDREVRSLRALGCEVITFTLRSEADKNVRGEFQNLERTKVHCLFRDFYNPIASVRAIVGAVIRPTLLWHTIRLASETSPTSLWGIVRQVGLLFAALHFAVHLKRSGAVHIHNHLGDSSGTVAFLASKIASLPFSMTLHGPEIFDPAGDWHLRRKIKDAAFVACISKFCLDQTARQTEQGDLGKLKIVRCGIEPDRYGEPTARPNAKKLLFVGRLEPRKGVATLIGALDHIYQMQPQDIHLTIAGDGSGMPDLKSLLSSRTWSSSVELVGAVDEAEVAKLLMDHDILIVPSLSEGLPVVIMEAFASGRSVIASAVDGIPELVVDGQTGLLFPPADRAALASAIMKLFGDDDLCARLAKNGRRSVLRDHDARINAKQLLDLMRSLAISDRASNA